MKGMRKAGGQIEALIEYVALYQQGEETARARKAILEEQREQLRMRLEEMQESLHLLDKKIQHYEETVCAAEENLRKIEKERGCEGLFTVFAKYFLHGIMQKIPVKRGKNNMKTWREIAELTGFSGEALQELEETEKQARGNLSKDGNLQQILKNLTDPICWEDARKGLKN